MAEEEKQRFEAEADVKAAGQAPEAERRGLLTCLEADRPVLTQRLDALCASNTSSSESVVAALKRHAVACSSRSTTVAQTPSAPPQQVVAASDADRLDRLERDVGELTKRLDRLENPSTGIRRGEPPSVGWTDRENWRQLRAGMKPAEVEQLLGQPASVMKNEYWTTWHYGENVLRGSVDFTPSMKVKGWTEP